MFFRHSLYLRLFLNVVYNRHIYFPSIYTYHHMYIVNGCFLTLHLIVFWLPQNLRWWQLPRKHRYWQNPFWHIWPVRRFMPWLSFIGKFRDSFSGNLQYLLYYLGIVSFPYSLQSYIIYICCFETYMANSFITRKFEFCDATRRNSIELHLSHGSKYIFPLIPRNLTNG